MGSRGTGIRDQELEIQDRYDDDDLPGGAGSGPSSSWSHAGSGGSGPGQAEHRAYADWNAAVPPHMRANAVPGRVPPPPDGWTWKAVFEAVAKNAFLCGEGRRVGPASLPWVLRNPGKVLEHTVDEPPKDAPKPKREIKLAPFEPPPPMPDWLPERLREFVETQDTLPIQMCPLCGETFRQRHASECWDCYAKRNGLRTGTEP